MQLCLIFKPFFFQKKWSFKGKVHNQLICLRSIAPKPSINTSLWFPYADQILFLVWTSEIQELEPLSQFVLGKKTGCSRWAGSQYFTDPPRVKAGLKQACRNSLESWQCQRNWSPGVSEAVFFCFYGCH